MSENPYQAPQEPPVRAELAESDRPKQQFPPLGYMFVAAFFLQAAIWSAWYVIPRASTASRWDIAVAHAAFCAVNFLFMALALRPVCRWFSTGRYH